MNNIANNIYAVNNYIPSNVSPLAVMESIGLHVLLSVGRSFDSFVDSLIRWNYEALKTRDIIIYCHLN